LQITQLLNMTRTTTHNTLLRVFLATFFFLSIESISAQNYEWAKALGGPENELVTGVITDASDHVIVCGTFYGRADFDPSSDSAVLVSNGDNDIFLAKYDRNGNYLWAVNIGGTDFDAAASISAGTDQHIYVTGVFRNTVDFDASSGTANRTSYGEGDIFLVSYDSSGQFRWVRQMGGSSIDNPTAVSVDGNHVYVSGDFQGSAKFNPANVADSVTSAGFSDIFLVKYDTDGSYIWGHRFGGAGYDGADKMSAGGSSVCIAGTFGQTVDFNPSAGTDELTSADLVDVFLAKYSSDGDFAWTRNIGGTGSELIRSMALDASGNIYMAGIFSDSSDMDPSASVLMIRSSGKRDIFLTSISASGNLNWSKSFGGSEIDDCGGMDLNKGSEQKIYVTGLFRSGIDMDPSPATYQLASIGVNDIFIGSYTLNGDFESAQKIGGSGNDLGEGLSVDHAGNIVITGRFTGTVDFDPSSSAANLSVNGNGSDLFIAKYAPSQTTSVVSIEQSGWAGIYPNPSNGNFYIMMQKNDLPTSVSIYNSLGILIEQQEITITDKPISFDGPAGIYSIQIQNGRQVVVKTLVRL
jgi:hypothetical protein